MFFFFFNDTATTEIYTLSLHDALPILSTLEIRDLHVSVDTEDGPKEILKGVTLTIRAGETHAIMGPNGSGKSTLAYSVAGHPKYTVTGGTVTLDGQDRSEERRVGKECRSRWSP